MLLCDLAECESWCLEVEDHPTGCKWFGSDHHGDVSKSPIPGVVGPLANGRTNGRTSWLINEWGDPPSAAGLSEG